MAGVPGEVPRSSLELSILSPELHPSLRVKRLVGTADRREGSVTMNYRFTFQLAEGKVLFRRIGAHDILRMEG